MGVLASVPAVAAAQEPDNNDYYGSFAVNARGTALPTSSGGFTESTVGADLQTDIFEGNPGGPFNEPFRCFVSDTVFVDYDNTVWWDLYPHRPGNLTVVVRSSDFRPVVGVMPFDLAPPQRPNLDREPLRLRRRTGPGHAQLPLPTQGRRRNYTTQIGGPCRRHPRGVRGLFPVRPRLPTATAWSTAATNARRRSAAPTSAAAPMVMETRSQTATTFAPRLRAGPTSADVRTPTGTAFPKAAKTNASVTILLAVVATTRSRGTAARTFCRLPPPLRRLPSARPTASCSPSSPW